MANEEKIKALEEEKAAVKVTIASVKKTLGYSESEVTRIDKELKALGKS